MKLADHWLYGTGVEFGRGAHNPLAPDNCYSVAPSDGVRFVHPHDLDDFRIYVEEQRRYGCSPAKVDYVAETNALPFVDGALDYIASSHVIEHVPNLFGAWVEWQRVLREGGVCFSIVPKRTALPSDAARMVTTLVELVSAYENSLTAQDLLPGQAWRSHYHVFTLQRLLEALNWFNQRGATGHWLLEAVEENDSNVGNGHTLVMTKQALIPTLEDVLPALDRAFSVDDYLAVDLLARQALSLNFRIHEAWAMLGVAQYQTGKTEAAIEAMRQALVLQPEHADYLNFFMQLSGASFQYPLSLLGHLARAV